jgi:hypothetical protein
VDQVIESSLVGEELSFAWKMCNVEKLYVGV